MQAQASQVANQVASQLALSAQVAKAAHAAQAHVAQASAPPFNNHALMNQQPVFPHPIPIAPVNAPTPGPAGAGTPGTNKPNFNRMMSSAKENGVAASTSFSPQAGSPPPISLPDFHRAYDVTTHSNHHHATYINTNVLPFSRKRSTSNDASDSLSGEPAQKMVQVNGAAMVPAELTNQRVSPIMNTAPAALVHPPPIMKPNPGDFKLEGLPEINEDNEEFLAFLA